MATTIQVDTDTRDRLAALRGSRRETYDEVLRKLLALVPDRDDEGLYSSAFRVGLLDAKLEAHSGRTSSTADVKRRLGL